ncbi:peptidylprolyl isomerase [Rappaport israeli]|uniref:peptidylprolyl isomerase n=1 Tax=Rappaport israeli TaxID=1839807 RepID=UPI00093102F6|nr:peptidylprolyl isomerase [Rappaport israeli]
MFNDIRKQRKNLLTYVLVGLAGIGMLFLGVPLFNQPSVQFDALKVNGTPIPVSTLQQQITALQRQLPDIDTQSIERQAIEQLINRTLLEQHALESDYRLSKPALFTLIKNEFGSNDAYQSALRQMHTNASAYENATQRQETSKNYYQFLANSDLAPKALFEQYLNALTQTRNYTLIRLPFETTKEAITPTEAQIAEYYQNNSAHYQSKELVDLEYIVLDAANLVSDNITPQAIDEAHEEALKTQSKRSGLYIIFDNPEVAQNMAQAIERKERTFEDIYASIENDAIAGEAGELPLSAYGSAPIPIVDDALFNLANEGDSSPLLDTDYGKMLVLVTTIDNTTLPTREEVANQLQQRLGEELYYDLAAKAFDAALENKPFSQILNLTGITQTQELKQINPQTTNPDWLQDAKVQSQLFGANAIDINQIGEPIELDKHRSVFIASATALFLNRFHLLRHFLKSLKIYTHSKPKPFCKRAVTSC